MIILLSKFNELYYWKIEILRSLWINYDKGGFQLIIFLILLTVLSPVFAIPFFIIFLFMVEPKYKVYVMIMLSVSLGVILFQIVPNETMDLYRYYKIIDTFREISFNPLLLFNNSDPITYGLMYLVSKTYNNHFLPFISIILFYFLYYKAINELLCIYNLEKKYYNKAIFFILSIVIIIGTGTGVRFSLAIAMFMNGIVAYIKGKNKMIPFLWFIMSILSHITMFIPFVLYMICILLKNKPKKIVYVIWGCILMTPSLVLNILMLLSKVPFLNDLLVKFNSYFTPYNPGGNWFLFRVVIFILNLILLIKSQKYINDHKIKSVILLENFIAIIAIVYLPYYYISIRFINIFNNLIIFVMIYNWKNKSNNNYINLILLCTFILFSSYQVILFLEQDYGLVSGLRWFGTIFDLLK